MEIFPSIASTTKAERRNLVEELKIEYKTSINLACKICSVSQSAYYYKSIKKSSDVEIKQVLTTLAAENVRWGFNKMMSKIKLDGYPWNHKRVYRIYCELGLNLRVKPKKRLASSEAQQLLQPIRANICWSMDFMTDVLSNGCKFRTFNVIDDFNREALMVAPHYSIPATTVTLLLDEIGLRRGYPDIIRVDNGSEFRSNHFRNWANSNYIQPGKPAQNGFIERFNRTYREDILDMFIFDNLDEVTSLTDDWVDKYNNQRPHESLGNQTPLGFAMLRNYQKHRHQGEFELV